MPKLPHFGRTVRLVVWSGLIATALALSVIRLWLAPQASRYRVWLSDELSARLGAPIRIGALAVRMHGFEPIIALDDFDLLDRATNRSVLTFRRMQLRLDVPRTLWEGRLIWRSQILEGSRLVVQRDAEGRIGLVGFAGGDGRPGWLLAQGRIELTDLMLGWRDEEIDRDTLWVGQGHLIIENAGEHHVFDARLNLPQSLGQSLRVAGELHGDSITPESLHGRFYLAGRAVKAETVSPYFRLWPWMLSAGQVDLTLWADFSAGQLTQLAGRVMAQNPTVTYQGEGGSQSALAVQMLAGDFRWAATSEGWRLSMRRLRMGLFESDTSPIDLVVTRESSPVQGEPSLRLALSRVALEDVRAVLDVLPLAGEKVRAEVKAHAPQGELRDVKMIYAPSESGARWALCANFEHLGAEPVGDVPGGTGWSGRLCGDDRHGHIRLAVRSGSLSAPTLWAKPLAINSLSTIVRWRHDDVGWSWRAEHLTASLPGLNLTGRLVVDWNKEVRSSPFVDLHADLGEIDAVMLRDYLPLRAIPPFTGRWLGRAFAGGRIPKAEVLFHGRPDEFPFADGEGVFQSQVWADQLELEFDPQWPHLVGGDAVARFEGRAMTVAATGARIGEARIREIHAEVADWRREDWLAIRGEVETTVPQAMAVLHQSPLKRIPERLDKVAQAEGDANLSLSLTVPIAEGLTDVKVEGVAHLSDASLTLPALGQRVQHIRGDLRFNNEGMHADHITANFLGQPLAIAVDQRDGALLVDTTGRVGVEALADAFPHPAWRFMRGQSGYRLFLTLPESMDAHSQPMQAGVSSDLLGIAVNLPEPLGKRESTKRDLHLNVTLRMEGRSNLAIQYGDQAQAQLVLGAGWEIAGGELALGQALAQPSDAQGVRLLVDLPSLNLADWWEWVSNESTALPKDFPVLDAIDLRTARGRWRERDLGVLALRAVRKDDGWSGQMDSPYARGSFEWSAPEFARAKLALDLESLNWPKSATTEAEANEIAIDPAHLPAIRLRSRQFLWQGHPLGEVVLDTDRWTQGLNIRNLELQTDNHHLKLKGRWLTSEAGVETALDGKLEVKDLGRLVAELGFAKEIRETPSRIGLSLKWPGGPHQFSLTRVTGEVEMKLGKGRLPKVEPGLGRILGMLNLDNLGRRLRLDFSDMFGSGLAYDGILGRFTLDAGHAKTDSFLIDALAANIFFSGRTGLRDRDLDVQVVVVPHTSVAMPIAGTLAGGPAVGAAVLLAQQLVGDRVDSIAASHYHITGTWEDPKLTSQGGYMPMDVLQRAWSGLKDLSGFGE